MLSATPVIPLYQRLYQERLRLVETGQVAHRGKLYLHRERSYSRSSIASLKSGFPSIVEEFVKESDLDGVITFKEWTKEADNELLLTGTQQPIPVFSTFGATEGTNVATGKRIGVIGTPHLPEFTLKLLGHAVGIPSTEIELEYKPRIVRRAEFEASLWCLADTGFFQDLELTLVERELVQAVGRARLLENDVEVRVWSNYVLSGGELWRKAGIGSSNPCSRLCPSVPNSETVQ
jgi:hypothetical protein